MLGILAIAILLGWVVGWEQLRQRDLQGRLQAILVEDTNDPLSSYGNPQEALRASRRVEERARPWAEGGPSAAVVAGGLNVDFVVMGLALSINRAVCFERRKRRMSRESRSRS